MACGVTTTMYGATATCDNAGTSTHAGAHSGLINIAITIWGFTWDTTTRVWWKANVASPVRQKTAVLGQSDFA